MLAISRERGQRVMINKKEFDVSGQNGYLYLHSFNRVLEPFDFRFYSSPSLSSLDELFELGKPQGAELHLSFDQP